MYRTDATQKVRVSDSSKAVLEVQVHWFFIIDDRVGLKEKSYIWLHFKEEFSAVLSAEYNLTLFLTVAQGLTGISTVWPDRLLPLGRAFSPT